MLQRQPSWRPPQGPHGRTPCRTVCAGCEVSHQAPSQAKTFQVSEIWLEDDSIEFHCVILLLAYVSGSHLVAGGCAGQVADFPQGGCRGFDSRGKREGQLAP